MRTLARLLASTLLLLCIAAMATAEDYPTKPVKIIVPFAAGGPADIYARFLGQRLQEALGSRSSSRTGPARGSVIGTEAVAKSRARRLHAADDVEHADRQRVADAEQAVRADARFRRRSRR